MGSRPISVCVSRASSASQVVEAEPLAADSADTPASSPALSESSSSSSSESSSDSSSDSSDSDSDGAAGDVPAAAAEAPASSSSKRRPREDVEPSGPPATRRRRDETFEWRNFRFTYRPGQDNRKPSYMVLCRYHSRAGVDTKCTRTASWNDPADRDLVVRRLKTWRAPDFPYDCAAPDRLAHQSHDKKGIEAMSDAELDAKPLPPLPA